MLVNVLNKCNLHSLELQVDAHTLDAYSELFKQIWAFQNRVITQSEYATPSDPTQDIPGCKGHKSAAATR